MIAHEFGHFAKRHGRSASFVYRVRMRWARIANELPEGIVASGFRRFFRWYAPWFAAYSFTLARQQEYDADAIAAKAAGPAAIANALKRIEMQGARSEHQWNEIWKSAFDGGAMPHSPSNVIASRFVGGQATTGESEAAAAKALSAALKRSPGLDDTHPTLAQRLAALGEDGSAPPPLDRCAADDLLGADTIDALAESFDAEWRHACSERWGELKAIRRIQLADRDALLARLEEGLTRSELERLAEIDAEIDGAEGAVRGYSRVLDRDPEDGLAAFQVGMALASLDRAEAADLLEKCCEHEPQLAPAACSVAIELFDRIDRPRQAQHFRDRLIEAEARAEAARTEDAVLNDKSQLETIEPGLREDVLRVLESTEGLARVYGAQRVRCHSTKPQLIILFKCSAGAAGELVAEWLVSGLGALRDVLVMEESFDRRWLKRRMRRLDDSCLLDRR